MQMMPGRFLIPIHVLGSEHVFFFFKFLNPGYCISSQSGVFPTVTPIAAGRISPILQEVTTCLAQV
jgi:hypothetical protein